MSASHAAPAAVQLAVGLLGPPGRRSSVGAAWIAIGVRAEARPISADDIVLVVVRPNKHVRIRAKRPSARLGPSGKVGPRGANAEARLSLDCSMMFAQERKPPTAETQAIRARPSTDPRSLA